MIISRYTEQNNTEDYVAFDRNSRESEFYLQGISWLVDTIAMSDGTVMGAADSRIIGAVYGRIIGAAEARIIVTADGQFMISANGQVMGVAVTTRWIRAVNYCT